MSEKLSKDEVGILIQAKKIMRAKGLDKDVDVSKICQTAGISRKTGYQWAERYVKSPEEPDGQISQKLRRLEAEHEALKKLYDDVQFENEGRKLAWEIHGVDEMLRSKKTLQAVGKAKSGSLSSHNRACNA
jgi:transposase